MVYRFVLLLCVVISLTACGAAPAIGSGAPSTGAARTGSDASAPTVAATAAALAAAPSATALATATVAASPTTAVLPTLAPTETPAPPPTAEPSPTVAAEPTAEVAVNEAHDTPSLADVQGQPVPAAPAAAPASASDPVRLQIDEIALDRNLVSVGLDANRVPIVPKHDIAWYNLSAQPGQGENVVMWGHVLRFKSAPKIPAPFARLKELPIGARITVHTANGGSFTYVVSEKVYARPDQVEYILPVGSERLTLVSCIGDKVVVDGSVEMSHRLITIAVPE